MILFRKWKLPKLLVSLLAFGMIDAIGGVGQDSAPCGPIIVLVFCDMTATVDASNIPRMAKSIERLYLAIPPGSRLVVLPISCQQNASEILDITKPPWPRSSSQRRNYQYRNRSVTVQIGKRIDSLYSNYYRGDSSNCSCIIETFTTAQLVFQAAEQSAAKPRCFELIYFSDMLQDCATQAGRSRVGTKDGADLALNQLRSSKGAVDLSFAHVTIVESSSPHGLNKDDYSVPHAQLLEFWQTAFGLVGISISPSDSVSFSTQVPERLTDERTWQ